MNQRSLSETYMGTNEMRCHNNHHRHLFRLQDNSEIHLHLKIASCNEIAKRKMRYPVYVVLQWGRFVLNPQEIETRPIPTENHGNFKQAILAMKYYLKMCAS